MEVSLRCSKPSRGCWWCKRQGLLYNRGIGASGRAGEAKELLDAVPLPRSNKATNAKLENEPRNSGSV